MIRSDHAVAALFHLRKARADDEAFRYRLFSETAGAEFMTLVGDEGLLQIQYRAREMSYAMNFSGAQENVICLADGKPVGRVLTYSQPGTMTLVDIGLLQAYRGQGIGTAVLENLQQECRKNGLRLELQVKPTNPATKLYFRIGFTTDSQDAAYAQLSWQAAMQAG